MSGVFRPLNPLPIPIELRKLSDQTRDGRLEYGARRFNTVITFGKVISSYDSVDMSSLRYKVADPKDSSVIIDVIVFKGLTSTSQPRLYEEETLLFIGARLNFSKGKLALQSFRLREVTNVAEYDSFCMESILAWDYHTKTSAAEMKMPRSSLPSFASSPSLSSNKRPYVKNLSEVEPVVKKTSFKPVLKRQDSFDDDDDVF